MAARFKKEHLILYLVILTAYLIFWIHNDLATHPSGLVRSLQNNVWQVVFVIGVNLIYFEYVLPFVTSKKHYRFLLILASLTLHLSLFMVGLYAWHLFGSMTGVYRPFEKPTDASSALSAIARFTPGAFLLFAVFKLFFDYNNLRYEGQRVLLEKKQAELVFLKSQVNPHFLFNTLNNIYSLSQYEPHLVSESVLRLSKILRYVLYETDNELIAIEKEIKVLSDYIDLERLRYSENVRIGFIHKVEDATHSMPPLLLLPLVENAFKHGVSQSRGSRFVDVNLSISHGELYFVVKNSCHASSKPPDMKDGIGLSNLKRRLSLIYKDFNIVTEQDETTFTATLTINLRNHV